MHIHRLPEHECRGVLTCIAATHIETDASTNCTVLNVEAYSCAVKAKRDDQKEGEREREKESDTMRGRDGGRGMGREGEETDWGKRQRERKG